MNRRAQTLYLRDNRMHLVQILKDGHYVNECYDFYYRRRRVEKPTFTGSVDAFRDLILAGG